MTRLIALCLTCLSIAACTNVNDLGKKPAYLGNFHLGHNVVVAPNLTKGPLSREASKEEWIAAMKSAIGERFDRYEGSKLYHLGISVEGYVLAVPGVPIVASPKSALILKVTAWDDENSKKLNPEPHVVTVVESISGPTFLGSGLTQSKETQMLNLSQNAAKQIQNWLQSQNEKLGWFEDDGQPAGFEKRTIVAPEDALEEAAPDASEADSSDAAEAAVDAARIEVEPEVDLIADAED